jgi:hypothetical protein
MSRALKPDTSIVFFVCAAPLIEEAPGANQQYDCGSAEKHYTIRKVTPVNTLN